MYCSCAALTEPPTALHIGREITTACLGFAFFPRLAFVSCPYIAMRPAPVSIPACLPAHLQRPPSPMPFSTKAATSCSTQRYWASRWAAWAKGFSSMHACSLPLPSSCRRRPLARNAALPPSWMLPANPQPLVLRCVASAGCQPGHQPRGEDHRQGGEHRALSVHCALPGVSLYKRPQHCCIVQCGAVQCSALLTCQIQCVAPRRVAVGAQSTLSNTSTMCYAGHPKEEQAAACGARRQDSAGACCLLHHLPAACWQLTAPLCIPCRPFSYRLSLRLLPGCLALQHSSQAIPSSFHLTVLCS